MNTVKVDLTSKMFDRYVVLVCSGLLLACIAKLIAVSDLKTFIWFVIGVCLATILQLMFKD